MKIRQNSYCKELPSNPHALSFLLKQVINPFLAFIPLVDPPSNTKIPEAGTNTPVRVCEHYSHSDLPPEQPARAKKKAKMRTTEQFTSIIPSPQALSKELRTSTTDPIHEVPTSYLLLPTYKDFYPLLRAILLNTLPTYPPIGLPCVRAKNKRVRTSSSKIRSMGPTTPPTSSPSPSSSA